MCGGGMWYCEGPLATASKATGAPDSPPPTPRECSTHICRHVYHKTQEEQSCHLEFPRCAQWNKKYHSPPPAAHPMGWQRGLPGGEAGGQGGLAEDTSERRSQCSVPQRQRWGWGSEPIRSPPDRDHLRSPQYGL